MTVVNLIEELQNLPLDAEVFLSDDEFRCYDVDYDKDKNRVIIS